MSPTEAPRQPHAFALWREAQDTRIRTRLGGIYYLLAWLLTWLFSAAPGEQWLLCLVGSGFFALMLAARLLHRLPEDDSPQAMQCWIDRHWILIFVTALGWGLAHAWFLSDPLFADSKLIATLSTIAFTTALAFNFPMRKGRAVIALLLLYLPGLSAMALDWEQQRVTLVTLAFYLTYLVLALTRSHREYRDTLNLEMKLLEHQERLEVLTRTDSLTQLGNRYQFNSLFPVMVANAQRQQHSLSLVLLDIDFFKRVNDEHGHACGDACLSAFAERMRQVFRRDSDALLRLGGEEFGVLMPNTSLEQAHQLAESFRHELALQGFEVNGLSLPLTASLGVGCFDLQRDACAESFFKRVDDALYLAKSAGRNRLVQA
ncbi:GGDEF domain-containing protein [Pseudomonas sp.]|uniref:GGDEF domain-containing protein n=1 Tax=Pseudomonas sp. TaxID=306 RepID=UPI002BDF3A20|nr:GGDEF domain-containing protein [Pseudomonas sp.]